MTESPRKILVIQLRRIGDVILTTPALAALKARYPEARIDFLVEPSGAEALEGNPHIAELLVYRSSGPLDYLRWFTRLRAQRYDWVIDYMGNPRSAFLSFFSGAALRAGPAHVGHRWAYNRRLIQSTTTQYAALEKVLVLAPLGVSSNGLDLLPKVYLLSKPAVLEDVIALAPASRKETRRWPAASYAALGRRLREKTGSRIRVFWGPGERALAQAVVDGVGPGAELCPETPDLAAAARQLAGCRLLITNCSGTKHLASALGVATLTIHGSSDPASWTPAHPRHGGVRLDTLFCIGCQKNACPYALECMTQLSPETVLAKALALLGSAKEARA